MLRLIEADTFPNTVAPPEINLPSINSRTRLVLGRGSPSCPVDVTISATRDSKEVISRRHAEIVINKGGRHVIRDLGSLNGVFVNSIRISETILKQNDVVQFGGVAKIAVGEKIHASDVSIRYMYVSASKRAIVSSDSSNTSSKKSRNGDVDNTNNISSAKETVDERVTEMATPNAKSFVEQSEHATPSNGVPHQSSINVVSSSITDSSPRDIQSGSNDSPSFDSSTLTYMQANCKVLQTENSALKQLQVAHTSTIMELSRGLDELRREYDRLVQELQSVQRQSRDERARLTTEINMKNDLLEKASIQLCQRSNSLSDVDVATIAATTTIINANIANQLNSDTCRIDISALRSQLSCSLCSDVLVNAVLLPCSHGFCRKCIEVHWTRQHSRCPLCYDPYPHHNPEQLFYFRSTHLEDILWLITEALPVEAQAIVRHRESEDQSALNILGIREETHMFSPELMRSIGTDINMFGQRSNGDTRTSLLDDPLETDARVDRNNCNNNSNSNSSTNNNIINSTSKLKCKYCLELGHSEDNCHFQNENIIHDGADTDDSLDV